MAKCINVLITLVCVTSFFSPTSGALKVCEYCSTGIACYVGVEDPHKGQCASSCDACTTAGYESCQSCLKDCIAVPSSETCINSLECCGSMSKQATCEGNRCCTTLDTFCSSATDCCKGLYCSPSTNTCVSDATRDVTKLSDMFGAESPAVVNTIKNTLEYADDLVDNELVDKIKGDTGRLIERMDADNSKMVLLDKLRTKTAEISNRVKPKKEDVVQKAKQGEGELVEAVKAARAALTGAMKQGDAPTMVEKLADEMNEKVRSVLNETDSKRFKAKVDAIFNVDKVRAGIENLKAGNEELKAKINNVFKVDNANELRERIDRTIKEDREMIKTRMNDTKAKMDETKKSIEEWTTTNLRSKYDTAYQLYDLEVCDNTNSMLVKESSTINRLIVSVGSLFHEIEKGIEGTHEAGPVSIRQFFRDIALDPKRREESFQDVRANKKQGVSEREEETAEEPMSLYELCKAVTAQLEKQNKQLTKVLNGLMDMLKAEYDGDFKQFKTKGTSLFIYISDILKNAIEPADGITPMIDWSEVLSSLPEVGKHFLMASMDGDETKTPSLPKVETRHKQGTQETDEIASDEGDAEESASEEDSDEETAREEGAAGGTVLKLPKIKDLSAVLPFRVAEQMSEDTLLPSLGLNVFEDNTSSDAHTPAVADATTDSVGPTVSQSVADDNETDDATGSAETITVAEASVITGRHEEPWLMRLSPEESIQKRMASLKEKLNDLLKDLEKIN